MAVQVRVTSAASQDLIQAHDWYEQQSPGLGKEFVRTVDAVLAFIERNPTLFGPAYHDLRRVLDGPLRLDGNRGIRVNLSHDHVE